MTFTLVITIRLHEDYLNILFHLLGRMDFEPSEGKYLAYPNNKDIILLDCESWSQRMVFTHNSVCTICINNFYNNNFQNSVSLRQKKLNF